MGNDIFYNYVVVLLYDIQSYGEILSYIFAMK